MSESDRLEVVDSSKTYFGGSSAQPDISLFLPGAPLRVLQCVKSVVELETTRDRPRASRRLFSGGRRSAPPIHAN